MMKRDTKIYIAGHRGLVGSALVRRLTAAGYRNLVTRTSAELDLKRQADVEAFFSQEKPEYVFLAAGKVGGILANSTYKADFIYDNVMIAANVIHASHRSGVKKLLNLGSSCIYPKFAPQPMREEHLLTGALEPTNEPYAVAKIAAIKLCRYFNEQYKKNFISVMPTNLYGPGDNFDLETSHVLPALIRKMHLAGLCEQGGVEAVRTDLQRHPQKGHDVPLHSDAEIAAFLSKHGITRTKTTNQVAVEIWGSGDPFREFLYVDDLADACIFLMERYDADEIGEFINIGSGSDIRIRDLAALVQKTVGFTGAVVQDRTKPDGTPKKLLDVGRLKALGWEPKVGLEEGIKRTYACYREKPTAQQLLALPVATVGR